MVGMDLGAIVSEASGDNAWEVEQDLAGKADRHADYEQKMKEQAAEDMRAFLEEKKNKRSKFRTANRCAKRKVLCVSLACMTLNPRVSLLFIGRLRPA
jgi:hypothetical protein